MFKFIIFFLLLFTYINANSNLKPKLSYNDSINLAHSAKKYGIEYGNGKQNVYVFVDPLCRYSRKFISMVSKKPKMLSKYKYHIYLYEIPRLNSEKTISAIYSSKKPLKTLLEVMLNDKNVSALPTKQTQDTITTISEVAKKLHITKRPSIIVEK